MNPDSALYMAFVSAAGFTGLLPSDSPGNTNPFFNGVYSSMFMHTAVVLMTVFFRLASAGHPRDSDKLLFLWRSRYVSLITLLLFLWGTVSAVLTLMYMLVNNVIYNDRCMPGGFDDPTMTYHLWWRQWTGEFNTPRGKGVIYPEGEEILNPWMNKTRELNIFYNEGEGRSGLQYQQYTEFMLDYWGFAQPCGVKYYLERSYGGDYEYERIMMVPYVFLGLVLPTSFLLLWVAPKRHIFNYWAAERSNSFKYYIWGFLGFFSFHFFGPLASNKIDDPFDLTEAFEEFQLRAEVGRVLALKDENGDGVVKLPELREVVKHGEESLDSEPSKRGSQPIKVLDCDVDMGPISSSDGDKALKDMQEFLQSIDPVLSNYAHAFVRDLLTPNLLRHLPWGEFRGYGIPNGHISLICEYFSRSGATA